ncbi:insulinase family protein, partial [Candidatus Uhrbacteria bacterium]|nr:insulinase family protein [Candidatus Uhrbacteria bacterium]
TRHIDDLLEGVTFEGNTLGWEIAGSAKTMQTMQREDVMAFRDQFYVPSRMSIAVAGAVPDDAIDWLEGTFGNVEERMHPVSFEKFQGFASRTSTPMRTQTKTTEQAHVGWGFPGLPYTDAALPAM